MCRSTLPTLATSLAVLAACADQGSLSGPEVTAPAIELRGGTCELGGSPAEILSEIARLQGEIDALEAAGALTSGQALALRNHLENARRALESGNPCAARASLAAFREQVHEFVGDGVLTDGDAVPLLEGADRALGDVSLLVDATVTAGGHHTCGLTAAGRAYCWGYNFYGQLGDASFTDRASPAAVAGDLSFATMSAGGHHSCGVTTGGIAYCWGSNEAGQVGDGTSATFRGVPTAVNLGAHSGLKVSTIAAGYFHTCGLTPFGHAYCWGYNAWGQLGDGSTNGATSPVAVAGGLTFAAISVGAGNTCGISIAGEAYCWGNNQQGETGDGTLADRRVIPTAVTGDLRFATISVGSMHACGLTTDGRVYCWGNNSLGQLGGGTTALKSHVPVPVALPAEIGVSAVVAGDLHTCSLTTTGLVYCWGANQHGQLGSGTMGSFRATPAPADLTALAGLGLESLSAEASHACGLAGNGSAYCWGLNEEGQVGDGTTTNRAAPTAVLGWPPAP